jgi:cytoskeletal protein CcmA (bactofilin family)
VTDFTASKNHSASAPQATVIGRACRIIGDLTLEGDATILGAVEGGVAVSGTLQIGPDGGVTGTVRAGALALQGHCRGDVHCSGSVQLTGQLEGDVVCGETIEIAAKSALIGNLFAKAIRIADGASYEGHVIIGPNAAAESEQAMAAIEHQREAARPIIETTLDERTTLGKIADGEPSSAADADRSAMAGLLRRRAGVLTRSGAAGA